MLIARIERSLRREKLVTPAAIVDNLSNPVLLVVHVLAVALFIEAVAGCRLALLLTLED